MNNSDAAILKKIKEAFLLTNQKRNIRLPSSILFNLLEEDTVVMKLSSKAVSKKMQDNMNAFEGWALVLRRWGNYNHVIISWDKPTSIDDGHYQRFLFRLKNFSQAFNSWFSINKDCQLFIDDLKINQLGRYLLNKPGIRGDKVSPKPEAILENRFVNGDLKERLMKISNATFLYRQLPVGVFKDEVSKYTSIFTSGKSAIDIWGFNQKNDLLVFELKPKNVEMVGIISELYFYVCVLQMLRQHIFKHEDCLNGDEHLLEITKTKKIKAYFLAPTLHPLIDEEMINLLNETDPNEVSYHYIHFNENYELSLDVFN